MNEMDKVVVDCTVEKVVQVVAQRVVALIGLGERSILQKKKILTFVAVFIIIFLRFLTLGNCIL